MPEKKYEFLEHTADIAARIYGKDLPEIFINAGQAMFMVLAARRAGAGSPPVEITVRLYEKDPEELLICWLNELLFLYATRELVFTGFRINSINGGYVDAVLIGENISQFEIKTEIKAATYHGLKIEETQDGCLRAEVIFDV